MNAQANIGKPKPSPRVVANKRDPRYIVFRPILQGQGAGNIVHGLLAVHALAEEFGRIVCTPEYHDFDQAFEPVDAHVQKLCKHLKRDENSQEIRLINYEMAPDECELQRRLASDVEVIYILGNTYPRWRPIVSNFFLRFYKPRPELQELLPEPMPKTVVHLRKGDQGLDRREGLDDASLEALGKALPSDTFLVTNNVKWYDYFSKKYSWRHPDWGAVYHSASKSFMWELQEERQDLAKEELSNKRQNLQLWSDWYAIAYAELVWHTHSDFSLSAIHWMNIKSRTIKGIDARTGELKLVKEAFRTDEVMLPLKDRGPDDIKNCGPQEMEQLKARYAALGLPKKEVLVEEELPKEQPQKPKHRRPINW